MNDDSKTPVRDFIGRSGPIDENLREFALSADRVLADPLFPSARTAFIDELLSLYEGNPFLKRCRQTQRPQNGRKASIDGFASAPMPHKVAKVTQPRQPCHSCSSSATRKIRLRISGVDVVSQIQ